MHNFKKIHKFIVLIVLFGSFIGHSQLSKTHYIPPLTSAEFGNANPESQYIYLSTPSQKDIAYTIKPVGQPTSSYISGVVSNTNPKTISLGSGNGQLFVASGQTSLVMKNKGYLIEAEGVIYASVRMNAGGGAQAGALVSKGLTALGTVFRAGSYTNENPQDNYLNFVSIMATEDNTQITFSDLPSGINIKNYSGTLPVFITLNKLESYILATNSLESMANRDGLIGCLVQSDKNIVVNTGSANGSFHNGNGRDYGIDQIVDLLKVGKEYIFVQGDGDDNWENVLIVAHYDNTRININGSVSVVTIDSGEYYLIEGNRYSSFGNMYVETSEPVFAYQGVGATNGEANQGMFFVPPLSCETRGALDNIANIGSIGSTNYTGGISIVTKKGATVSINNISIDNYSPQGPRNVTGNDEYVTYKITGLSGNISVQSTDELYCAYFNYNGAATSGSFYSGFPTAPEINFEAAFETLGICIPNITLSVANLGNFDSIEWFYDDGSGFVSTGETTSEFTPTLSGTYKLIGTLTCSNLTLESLEVPVSICPSDIDNDGIIDNIDIDNDNDGILNCAESFGDQQINLSNLGSGTIPVGNISFSGNIQAVGNANVSSLIGSSNGIFNSVVPNNFGTTETYLNYHIDFNKEINIRLEIPESSSLGSEGLTNVGEFIIQVPNTRTITLLDPDNQLLVDTDYDGKYESGISQFSGFEIRFRLKSTTLVLGSGTFSFVSNQVNSFSLTHINNSESTNDQAIFRLIATCVARDTDSDGIEDALDYDGDNDGVPDRIENQGSDVQLSRVDDDFNGLDDVFDLQALALDSDADGIINSFDLDSDNDGIFDMEEASTIFIDGNFDGMIDNAASNIGMNGWVDSAETAADSGLIGYVLEDTDADGLFNYISLDSDGDLCSDVIEAGFSDANGDGLLGDQTVQVTLSGLVSNANDGYTSPHQNYTIGAPIEIIEQPESHPACFATETEFSIETNDINGIQWQLNIGNGIWTNLIDDAVYAGTQMSVLSITNIVMGFHNYKYRALLAKNGNGCGLISEEVILTVNPLPIVNSNVSLHQCDTDTDGFSAFNLTEVNDEISYNAINETFTYHTSLTDANTGLNPIADPLVYINKITSLDVVWARVTSEFGCSEVSEIELKVSTTGIPPTFQHVFYQCDDDLDSQGNDNADNDKRDGVATFDFSSITQQVIDIFPIGQQIIIQYYRNEDDALAELNPIENPSIYRNIGYPNSQQIYIRVDSELANDCLGLGSHITLNVEALPVANPVIVERECDDDQDSLHPFDVAYVEGDLLLGQTDMIVTYFDENNNALPSPLPNPFLTSSQFVFVRMTNANSNSPDGPCYDETIIEFTVDKAPIAYPVPGLIVCDDDENDTDGIYDFDTSIIQNTILGGQTMMEVQYFDSNGDELPSHLPNPFTSASQSIMIKVVNPINPTCEASTTLNLQVNPLPEFEVDSPRIICITEPASIITLDAYHELSETFDYEWKDSNGTLLSNNQSVEISNHGIYFITLIKTDGTRCTRTKEVIVDPSEVAKIDLNDLVIVDDSDNNSVTILDENQNLGLGDYEYAMDNQFALFQDEPYFDQVAAGIHTLYIRDKNGCGISAIDFSVLGFPKFITPNNDGFNDSWSVKGVNEIFYSRISIYIFDKFGKVIAQLDPKNDGWDGLYNGKELPSTDYWFSVELIGPNGLMVNRKGHFSLIR